ncbi:cystic fibrosis transmembrane conductance regulator [Elysia marginata]|uniref:Cystic fibrosis transmembrane conductance regulator n=1 Tax=Elysia marginata TaxID=1093978 RepID=A0AAV4J0T1_9GAST|nr:cystic fibrosis transmembrane conductance regulator [Elysia marginata]
MDESLRHDKPNPFVTVNPLSKWSYWWLNPLFKKGYKGWLEECDMYNVCPSDSSKTTGEKLQAAWSKELERHHQGKRVSFLRALLRVFGGQFMLVGLLAFVEEMIKIAQPVLLAVFLDYFSQDSKTTSTEAWLYATGVVLCAVLIGLLHHPYFFESSRVGMKMRVSSCSIIYKKSLRLSNKSLNESSAGQIVNLMSNDVARFDHVRNGSAQHSFQPAL